MGGLAEYGKLDRNYIPFDEMGDNVKLAVIASEDQNYFKHNGFDFKAIERAMKHNEKKTRKPFRAVVQFPSRQPKIYSSGMVEAGCGKVLKLFILLL